MRRRALEFYFQSQTLTRAWHFLVVYGAFFFAVGELAGSAFGAGIGFGIVVVAVLWHDELD